MVSPESTRKRLANFAFIDHLQIMMGILRKVSLFNPERISACRLASRMTP
jgi:hypothetical protein